MTISKLNFIVSITRDRHPVESFSPRCSQVHPHPWLNLDLFDILYRAAIEAGATIRFGQSFESVIQNSTGITARTRDAHYDADALIGADGIRSRVRSTLFGEQPTRYAGYVCWRGIVSEPDIVSSVHTMNEIWGDGARFGFLRCRQDQIYWFATKTDPTRDQPGSNWHDDFRWCPNHR